MGNTGFKFESRIFYFIDLQNEEDYERKESSSVRWDVKQVVSLLVQDRSGCEQVSETVACSDAGEDAWRRNGCPLGLWKEFCGREQYCQLP